MSEDTRDPADSAVQRELEPVVLARLAAELKKAGAHHQRASNVHAIGANYYGV